MSDRFSLYIDKKSKYHTLHPLTKLTLALFLIGVGLILPGIVATYVLFCVVILPLSVVGQVSTRLLRVAALVLAPFALSLVIIQGFFWAGGPVVVRIAFLSLKLEGILFAIRIIGRLLVVISSTMLLSLTTRPDALMLALTERGLSPPIAYIIVSTIQIVPRFQARARTILDAQQARGLEITGNIVQRLRALVPLVIPLILSSIVDVEERAIALEARGFNRPGARTSLLVLEDSGLQKALRWGLLGILLALALVVWVWRPRL